MPHFCATSGAEVECFFSATALTAVSRVFCRHYLTVSALCLRADLPTGVTGTTLADPKLTIYQAYPPLRPPVNRSPNNPNTGSQLFRAFSSVLPYSFLPL